MLKNVNRTWVLIVLLCSLYACKKAVSLQASEAEKEAQQLADSLRDSKELYLWMKSYERQNERRAALIIRQMYGKTLRDESRFEEAIAQHDSCIAEAKELADTMQLIIALNHQGTNSRRMGVLQNAADLHYEALELSDEFSDQESKVAQKNKVRALNGLGNVQLSLGNIEAAEAAFRRALEGEEKLESYTGQAINYANLGSIYERRGDLDSAKICYLKSMDLNNQTNNPVGIGLCYHYLGHLAEKKGDGAEAIRNFQLSYETSQPTGDIWHWLEACNALAMAYFNENQLDSAAKYIDLSLTSAIQINSKEHKAEAYSMRSKLEERKGQMGNALQDLHTSLAYADSVTSESNEQHVQNLRVNYEAKRRVQEVQEAETRAEYEKSMRKTLTWSIVVIVILAIIAVIVQIRAARTKRRAAELQKLANEQLLRASQERQLFYRNITHQLRTPLTVVIGMVNQLKDHIEEDDIQGQEELAATQRQSRELLDLVNRMIKVSKDGVDMPLSDVVPDINGHLRNEGEVTRSGSNSAIARSVKQAAIARKNNRDGRSNAFTDGATVVIAEDNEDVAALIQTIFQNNGYITHVARDGQEALEILQNNDLPDIVITDIAMPRMDGLELIRNIRADNTMNHLPIVVVSARVEDSERLEGLDAGAEVYLAKPFIVDELLLRAQKLLEQRAVLRKKFSSQEESNELFQNLESEEKSFFTLINETIETHISEPTLSSSVLADKVCMSRSQLNRKIKNLTGDDTSHYIRNRRMMLACHLLVTTTQPIGNIETQCGFDTPGYFSRTFKSMYGTTPTEYRRNGGKVSA
ncbi:MAG: response regulator [Bacteroidaceae bacterium]|nr:response regulator [Bacteroidaceae bacterium]